MKKKLKISSMDPRSYPAVPEHTKKHILATGTIGPRHKIYIHMSNKSTAIKNNMKFSNNNDTKLHLDKKRM